MILYLRCSGVVNGEAIGSKGSVENSRESNFADVEQPLPVRPVTPTTMNSLCRLKS